MTGLPIHPLRLYLFSERMTYKQFAEELKKPENGGVTVSPVTIQKWVLEGHMPRKPALIAVDKATGGQVTPASFL